MASCWCHRRRCRGGRSIGFSSWTPRCGERKATTPAYGFRSSLAAGGTTWSAPSPPPRVAVYDHLPRRRRQARAMRVTGKALDRVKKFMYKGEGNELTGVHPQGDAHAAGQRASPRTPHIFLPMRNNELDPSFQGLRAESSPLAPPVFDKTPNLHQDSLTPSVDGTEHVTQSWEVSQQHRDFGIQKTVAWNKHPYLPSPFSCV